MTDFAGLQVAEHEVCGLFSNALSVTEGLEHFLKQNLLDFEPMDLSHSGRSQDQAPLLLGAFLQHT